MTLGDWWQILDLYEYLLVWPAAFVTLVCLRKSRTGRGRASAAACLILCFVPHIHRAAGDAYFDYLCTHQAGEFIYRTVENVDGVLQMRPRDGSKDYFDRMAVGDIPEDPWGHRNMEAREPWMLLGKYRFFETYNLDATQSIQAYSFYDDSMKTPPGPNDVVARFSGYDGRDLRSFRKQHADKPMSEYGFTWREVRSATDWIFNVYQGEVEIRKLSGAETIAYFRGFFRSRPMDECPGGRDGLYLLKLLQNVLQPTEKTNTAGAVH